MRGTTHHDTLLSLYRSEGVLVHPQTQWTATKNRIVGTQNRIVGSRALCAALDRALDKAACLGLDYVAAKSGHSEGGARPER